jgi:hypothetical protein
MRFLGIKFDRISRPTIDDKSLSWQYLVFLLGDPDIVAVGGSVVEIGIIVRLIAAYKCLKVFIILRINLLQNNKNKNLQKCEK